MKLTWKKERHNGWSALSGELTIGWVGQREDGTVYYRVDAVRTRWIAKGYGEVKSIASGKRAVNRAWRQWLIAAGLLKESA